MANFTPDEMAAINEMGRAGMLSPERVQELIKEMAPQIQEMRGLPGIGSSLAHQMLRLASGAYISEGELRALVPSFLRVETDAALTEEEIQAAMEALMRPRPMQPSLGALPGGEDILPGQPRAAYSSQELMQMQGAN